MYVIFYFQLTNYM